MKERLMKKFEELFGSTEDAGFYFSPGRVNLIGEHTDYNGGHVFPCALTLGTYGIAKKRSDRILRLYSMNLDHLGVITATLDDLTNKPEYNWANYPLGVLWALKEKGYSVDCGMDLVIYGNIPNGSGLSSSASLEVLTGVIAKDLCGFDALSMTDIALIGQTLRTTSTDATAESWISLQLPWAKKTARSFWIPAHSPMSMHR